VADFLDEAILLLKPMTREIQNLLDALLQMKQAEGHDVRYTLDPCILLDCTIRSLSLPLRQPGSGPKLLREC
jgi:hypothetical protein